MTFPTEDEADMDRAEIDAQRRAMEEEQAAEGADTVEGCDDCVMFLANGDEPEDRDDLAADIAAQWPGYDLSPTGDGESWFSWSACGVCGCTLGGNRSTVAFWKCELVPA